MLRNFAAFSGVTVEDKEGVIGTLREMYFEDQNWAIRYFVVTVGSWFTGHDVLIPPSVAGEIDQQRNSIPVQISRDQVSKAPPIASEQPVSRQYEQQLYQHYQWTPYWGMAGGAGMIAMAMPPPVFQSPVEPVTAPDGSAKSDGDPHLRSSKAVSGYDIRAQDDELGHVSDYIIDDTDWRIRYLVIAMHHWLPGKHVLVAVDWVETISFKSERVFVNLPASAIKDAPDYDPTQPLSPAYEQRLHEHYARKGYLDELRTAAAERP